MRTYDMFLKSSLLPIAVKASRHLTKAFQSRVFIGSGAESAGDIA
jgi:hypothetical protein